MIERNTIHRIKDVEGTWQENEARDQIIIDYFKTLFTKQGTSISLGMLDSLQGHFSDEINYDLTRVYDKAEIKEALMQMSPLKAPGLDGSPPIFFQKYWSDKL